jgi:hypothetical protein
MIGASYVFGVGYLLVAWVISLAYPTAPPLDVAPKVEQAASAPKV